ncbi:MAG: tyrosine-type recombinase/integrase [Boseongicola sp. SB0670_bin_30]|nr:tyrosine-type recombinase/integrase [Boseongicola sp. SB0670_bin_30]
MPVFSVTVDTQGRRHMTSLRKRMINDMAVRGLSENTVRSYFNSVSGLARFYGRSPERISAQEVQDYLLHLHEQRGLSWKSCNCARHGIRFLYRITLGRPDPHFYVPGAKTPSVLPEILSHDELVRLFTVTRNVKHLAVLMTAYAAGLRASEICHLQVTDIDSGRMCLRVDQGKGNKDRYVPLSQRLLGLIA